MSTAPRCAPAARVAKLCQALRVAARLNSAWRASLSSSEVTRQCGDPSCACAWDPQRRHGPHLYLKFSLEGKAHSVYVPPDHAPALRDSHQAWLRFQEVGTAVAGANRERFLRSLDRDKQRAKDFRAKARAKNSP